MFCFWFDSFKILSLDDWLLETGLFELLLFNELDNKLLKIGKGDKFEFDSLLVKLAIIFEEDCDDKILFVFDKTASKNAWSEFRPPLLDSDEDGNINEWNWSSLNK